MRHIIFRAGAILSCLLTPCASAFAQGTAFTYQGRLVGGGAPANGSYDLVFSLFATNSGGLTVAGPVTNSATAVTNGLFTTPVDFGGGVFTGDNYWLELAVQTNGGSGFTTLAPRQPVSPTPYALYSANAATATTAGSAGSVSATNISGTVALTQLPAGVLTNGAGGVTISGTFSGNGAGVTNVNLARANSFGALTFFASSLGFHLSSSPGVGNSPVSVIASDVNADGNVDLITANYESDTLTVLTNDGRGGFVIASSPTVGSKPASVTAADVNGDGHVDLICANYDDNTLTVLTNDGRGGFVIASSPGVGSRPESVTAADVNGDGKMDLICADYGDNTLTVLTNNGSGGFVTASSPNVGLGPVCVIAADVNGDGTTDLISANFGNSTVTVLTNSGSGRFVLASSNFVGAGPYSITAADVNGDGKVDLISANYGNSTLTVLTNIGAGRFVHSSAPSVGHEPESVTAADVNGDGHVDLISANNLDGTMTVLTNDGNGLFAIALSPLVGIAPYSVTAVDVNGDGNIDLICAYSSNVAVWINDLTLSANFSGNGSGLTGLTAAQIPNLDASSITSGTLADARLSSNVALLNASQTFLGTNSFSGSVGIDTSLILEGSFMINTSTYVNAHPIYLRGGDEEVVDHHHGLAYTGGAITNFGGGALQYVDGPALWGNGGGVLGTRNLSSDAGMLVWTTAGVSVYGTFNNNSDRNAKQDFSAVAPAQILDEVSQLPVTEWSYKVDAGARHIGPTAQDFYSAFKIGTDDRHIAPIDEGGVALAAIQGLNQELKERDAQIRDLQLRLERLERLASPKPDATAGQPKPPAPYRIERPSPAICPASTETPPALPAPRPGP